MPAERQGLYLIYSLTRLPSSSYSCTQPKWVILSLAAQLRLNAIIQMVPGMRSLLSRLLFGFLNDCMFIGGATSWGVVMRDCLRKNIKHIKVITKQFHLRENNVIRSFESVGDHHIVISKTLYGLDDNKKYIVIYRPPYFLCNNWTETEVDWCFQALKWRMWHSVIFSLAVIFKFRRFIIIISPSFFSLASGGDFQILLSFFFFWMSVNQQSNEWTLPEVDDRDSHGAASTMLFLKVAGVWPWWRRRRWCRQVKRRQRRGRKQILLFWRRHTWQLGFTQPHNFLHVKAPVADYRRQGLSHEAATCKTTASYPKGLQTWIYIYLITPPIYIFSTHNLFSAQGQPCIEKMLLCGV